MLHSIGHNEGGAPADADSTVNQHFASFEPSLLDEAFRRLEEWSDGIDAVVCDARQVQDLNVTQASLEPQAVGRQSSLGASWKTSRWSWGGRFGWNESGFADRYDMSDAKLFEHEGV